MEPVVDRLRKLYEGRVDFLIYDCNASQEVSEFAYGCGVAAVPTFIFVNPDGGEHDRVVGGMSDAEFRATLDGML